MSRLFLFCFASSLFACTTQDTATQATDLDVAVVCHTAADCPSPTICGVDAACRLPVTTPPILKCTVDADCGIHERCNPICASSGTIGHICQPDGIPTRECPPPQATCTSDADCPSTDTCWICPSEHAPPSTVPLPHGTCLPAGVTHACPL